jgi:hypothetical protein
MLSAALSQIIPRLSRHSFAVPFSRKRVAALTDAERVGPVAPPCGAAHCRICGYTPRPPKPGEPDFSFEKILDHLERRHPYNVRGTMAELFTLQAQTRGDDSACEFHCGGVR